MPGRHGILGAHSPTNLPNSAMEPTEQSFTITVTAAISGKVFWTFASKHAGSLFVRYLKLTIQERLRLPSPFAVVMLKEGEIVDDFAIFKISQTQMSFAWTMYSKKEEGPKSVKNWP